MNRTRSWAFTCGFALTVAGVVSACAAQPTPKDDAAAFTGRHGINLHDWFTWTQQTSPSTYQLPVFAHPGGALSDAKLAQMRAAGFDFARLTVDPGVFVSLSGPPRDDALQRLRVVIDRLRALHMAVLIDMHPVSAAYPFGKAAGGGGDAFEKGAGNPLTQRYATAIAWLAGQLDQAYGGTHTVAFELLNEPDLACTDPTWPAEQLVIHKAVRAAAPRLMLVLTGACWDGIDGLTALDPAAIADDNTLYSIHFYEDHRFTHQGVHAGNDLSAQTTLLLGGLPYPSDARPRDAVLAEIGARGAVAGPVMQAQTLAQANKYLDAGWNRARIEQRMDLVANWAATHGIAGNRILMGEFGVNRRRGPIMGAYPADRLRWLTDVRSAAEARGFRWAFWSYGRNEATDFDIMDDTGQKPDPATLHALGLD